MRPTPRGHLGHESMAAVMAASVTANMFEPTHRFFVTVEYSAKNTQGKAKVHTGKGPCARLGVATTLTGADIDALVENHAQAALPAAARAEPAADRVLCKDCAVTQPGTEDLRDFPGYILGLHRLATARRVTAQLTTLMAAYDRRAFAGSARKRAGVTLTGLVGEARLFLAQYENRPDDPAHAALAAAKDALTEQLDKALQTPEWTKVHADLVGQADGGWLWSPLWVPTPTAVGTRFDRSYPKAVTMFAADATLETYAEFPLLARPVIRHLADLPLNDTGGFGESSAWEATSVEERGRSREAMRLAFSTATFETLSAPDKREAWFAAVEAACTPAPAEN